VVGKNIQQRQEALCWIGGVFCRKTPFFVFLVSTWFSVGKWTGTAKLTAVCQFAKIKRSQKQHFYKRVRFENECNVIKQKFKVDKLFLADRQTKTLKNQKLP
jgi:hypothetical protein